MRKKHEPDRTPRSWFRIERPLAEAGGVPTSADVYVYDVIGGWFGIGAQDFVQQLAALDVGQINLFVNSPGGDVFDATAMTNAIARHPANVTATVDGIAASAASFLITAADEVVMGQGSTLMIHDAWSLAMGNAQDLRDTADVLDKLSDNIAGLYAGKAGGTAADWRAVMLDETWYTADEAVEAGLADRVTETAGEPSNVFDLSVFAYAGRAKAPPPPIELIRAAALATEGPTNKSGLSHVQPETITVTDRPNNLAPAPADVDNAGAPAEKGEPVMGTQNEAPTEPETKIAPAIDMEAFAVAMSAAMKSAVKDELAPFLAQPVASPGVPASLSNTKKEGIGYRDAMNLFAARKHGTLNKEQREAIEATLTDGAEVFASLTNISLGDDTAGGLQNTNPPQWVGELVTKVPYDGLWDYITHDDLTSPNVQSFTLTTEPTGGDKSDGGGAVTSTGAHWTLATTPVSRWAGADSFDRTPFDFGIEASALSSYFRIQLRNYYIWRDGKLISALTSGLTRVYNTSAGTNSVIGQVTNQILEGVAAVQAAGGGLANIATMPIALYKSLLKNSFNQAPAFLTLDLGAISEGTVEGRIVVRPDLSATVSAGDVIVANGAGITGYELPGSPVRAEQMQVSIGNIDIGLFGYALALRDSKNYVAQVGQGS